MDVDGDMDMSFRCRCQLGELGVRDQTSKRHEGVRDRGRGGSRAHALGHRALSLVDAHARARVGDPHWPCDRAHIDGEKHTRDDPAAVPCAQRIESDMDRDRVRTGCGQGVWRKWTRFCRARVCQTWYTWRDGRVRAADLGCGAEPRSGFGQGAGVLTLGRASPLVGATGTEPVKKTKTTGGNGAATDPELSRRERLGKRRPTSASAWLTGPISASTPSHTRSSGRLVKRRPRSVATVGQGNDLEGVLGGTIRESGIHDRGGA